LVVFVGLDMWQQHFFSGKIFVHLVVFLFLWRCWSSGGGVMHFVVALVFGCTVLTLMVALLFWLFCVAVAI